MDHLSVWMHQEIFTAPQNKNHQWMQFPASVYEGLSSTFWFSPLPDTVLLRFVSSQGTCPFASTSVLFFWRAMQMFIFLPFLWWLSFSPASLDPLSSVEQDACCDHCLHGVRSEGTDAICGFSLKEACWPSEGDTAPLSHIDGPSL